MWFSLVKDQKNLHNFIKEMPKRVEALKIAKGSQTKYYRGVNLFNFKCFFHFDLVLLYLQSGTNENENKVVIFLNELQ